MLRLVNQIAEIKIRNGLVIIKMTGDFAFLQHLKMSTNEINIQLHGVVTGITKLGFNWNDFNYLRHDVQPVAVTATARHSTEKQSQLQILS